MRNLLVYVGTEAVRTNSRFIHLGNNLSELLRNLDMPVSGGPRGSITTNLLARNGIELPQVTHKAMTVLLRQSHYDECGKSSVAIDQRQLRMESRSMWFNDISFPRRGNIRT